MPSRILLVRHGETEWSRSGQHTGLTDIPLTNAGRRAARLLGERLRAAPWNGLVGARVATSPLRRASETCALAGFGDRAEEWGALVEWDYGAYEGRTTPEIRRERPGWLIWRDGVPGGEDIGQVAARADQVIARVAEGDDENGDGDGDGDGDGGDVLVFAHGHFLRTLAARWLGLDPARGAAFELGAASLSVLGHAYGEPSVERWNDTAHLDAGLPA